MSGTPRPGTISWTDLTVDEVDKIRDFYHAVVGWTPAPVSMGGYSDFVMKAGDEAVACVCHARGHNADLPPVWLVYITVDDLDHSLDQCLRLGGSMLTPPRSYGGGPLDVDRVAGMVGEGAALLVRRALAAAGVGRNDLDTALTRFLELYDERLLVHTRLYEGTGNALDALRQRTPLAVLTNKPQ